MKRTPFASIGACCFVLLNASAAGAQEIGVRAGLSIASMTVEPEADAQPTRASRRGFAGGVSVFITRSDRGGWQAEALVVQKGARGILRDDDPDDTIGLTYLEIPVLLHLDVLRQGDRSVYAVAGPSVAFRLRTSYTYYRGTHELDEFVKPVDAGVTLGGGVEAGLLIVDARYTWGLRDAIVVEPVAFRNRTFTLTAGVRWRR